MDFFFLFSFFFFLFSFFFYKIQLCVQNDLLSVDMFNKLNKHLHEVELYTNVMADCINLTEGTFVQPPTMLGGEQHLILSEQHKIEAYILERYVFNGLSGCMFTSLPRGGCSSSSSSSSSSSPDIDSTRSSCSHSQMKKSIESIESIESIKGGVQHDEKMISTIATIAHLYHQGMIGPYLIVTASESRMEQWRDMFQQWCGSVDESFPVCVYHGGELARNSLRSDLARGRVIDPRFGSTYQPVVIISSEILKKELTFFQLEVHSTWCMLVVDGLDLLLPREHHVSRDSSGDSSGDNKSNGSCSSGSDVSISSEHSPMEHLTSLKIDQRLLLIRGSTFPHSSPLSTWLFVLSFLLPNVSLSTNNQLLSFAQSWYK